jgi:para-aminobenzoate synthetase component 1
MKGSGFQSQLNALGASRTPFIFLIDFECEKPRLWKMSEPIEDFKFQFQRISNFKKSIFRNKNNNIPIFEKKEGIDFEQYQNQFALVKKEIELGNSFLVNLTAPTKVYTSITLEAMLPLIQSKYICYLQDEFISFSPETFIQIHNGKISAYPMKGTIDASIPNAKDIILQDQKEIAEHATIVDLIRNDLSKVATEVRVTQYRYYEEIKTQNGIIGQVSSKIEGVLPLDYYKNMGDILFNLLPAGSISGAPKQKTLEIIASAEGIKRGYYTGIAGYFDGTLLDSCVLIRYLQADNIYRSGGGITALSDVDKEYNEMLDKVYVPII